MVLQACDLKVNRAFSLENSTSNGAVSASVSTVNGSTSTTNGVQEGPPPAKRVMYYISFEY